MRLHRLQVTAFGPFARTEEVDFDELAAAGLYLIHGATGAGKTSVLDAICFALYAAVPGARAESRRSLHSDHAPAGAVPEVVLELTAAGRRLRITRSPSSSAPSCAAPAPPASRPRWCSRSGWVASGCRAPPATTRRRW